VIKKYFKFYNEYLKMFNKSQVIGVFILVIYSISNIIYPYFLKLIIDDAITNKNLHKLFSYTFLMIITIGISILFKYIKSIYFFNLGKKIGIHMKNSIFSNIFKYNLKFFRNYKIGEIVSILEQDVISIHTLVMNIVDVFINIITFCGLTFILFFLNWKITLVSLLVSSIYLFLQRIFGKIIKRIAYQISVKRGDFQAMSQEILNNISNIQLLNQVNFFKNKYNDGQNEYYCIQFKGIKERAKSGILDGAFEGINLILVLFLGGYLVVTGDLTVGSLFTLTLYVQKLFSPIVSLINDYMEIKKAQASVDRVCEILESYQYQIKCGKTKCDGINTINIRNLSFAYNNNKILKNINIKIGQGEKIAFIGENGSGKSTLMNIIIKLEDNYEGNILIDDFDITEFDFNSYYDKILFVKQEPFTFGGSILDNLIMGTKDITIEKIHEALQLVNLKNDIELMENGINTMLGEKGVKLSGGQAQKLALARIFLLNDYPIIILDEPTAALDLESEDIILKNIFKYKTESTIIVITHRREVLKYCNRVIEIRNKNIFDSNCNNYV
jgi:ABC-type bacteriocin/lantibiotic exporter with double-glycine peptidase domain